MSVRQTALNDLGGEYLSFHWDLRIILFFILCPNTRINPNLIPTIVLDLIRSLLFLKRLGHVGI